MPQKRKISLKCEEEVSSKRGSKGAYDLDTHPCNRKASFILSTPSGSMYLCKIHSQGFSSNQLTPLQ